MKSKITANANATAGQLSRLELEISATFITRYRESLLASQ
jgi:hypothetical protein